MKITSFKILLFKALFLCTLFVPLKLYALGESTNLILPGGKINALAEGAGFVFAATRGPKGIYASSDFGATWNFAAGGTYSNGSGSGVVTTSSVVIANLGRKIYWAPLSSLSAGSNDYSPNWQEVPLNLDIGGGTFVRPEIPQSIAVDDSFLFVATTYGNLKIVKLSNMTLQATSQIVQLSQVIAAPRIAINPSIDASNGAIYVQLGASDKSNAKIMRATYTISSGAPASWTQITPGGNLGDGGCGGSDFAGSSASPVNNGRFGGIFSAPNGVVYLTTQSGPLSSRGIYRSVNGGTCWRKVVGVASGQRFNSLDIRSAAFLGATHVIGRFVSTNGNANNNSVTFEEIPNSAVPFSAGLDSTALLLSQDASCGATNGDICAMASSAFGAIATTDIEAASQSTWIERQNGMQGLLASDIDQSLLNPNIAVLGLAGGIARSTNFALSADKNTATSVTFQRFVPQDASVVLPEPVFSVRIDPVDPNIVYVGNNRLLRASFDSNGEPTWSLINTQIAQGKVVRDIVVSSTKIYVVYAQVTDGLGGELRIFDRNTLAPQLTEGLLGKPINSLAVASFKGVDAIYVGVGGIRTRESTGADAGNRGLYRSSNGGSSFTKIETDSFLSNAAIASMAYDKKNDILYVAANDAGLADEFESGSDDSLGAEDQGLGKLFIISKASTSKFKITTPSKGFPSGSPVSAVVIAEKNGSQNVFAAVAGKLYQSNSKGDTWALLYQGLNDQTVRSLIFDDLVTSSTAGLETVTGDPNLIVSSKTAEVKAKSSNKITINFSKEFLNNTSNKRKVTATIGSIKTLISKRNALTVAISPKNSTWPSSTSKIKVRVKSGFKSQDGEGLDSDYDETVDGKTFSFTVKIKK